jgi:hypothetical protein
MVVRWLQKLIAAKRLWLGFCPHCNSDAPELYTCPVCYYYQGAYPPSEETKQLWITKHKAICKKE